MLDVDDISLEGLLIKALKDPENSYCFNERVFAETCQIVRSELSLDARKALFSELLEHESFKDIESRPSEDRALFQYLAFSYASTFLEPQSMIEAI